MKPKLEYLLCIAASAVLLAGCCTGRHTTHWEYKAAGAPGYDLGHTELVNSFLNTMAKDGWTLVEFKNDGLCIFRRPKN